MRLLHRWLFVCLLLVPSLLAAAEPAVQLSVTTDRPEALYSMGEQAGFLVKLSGDAAAIEGTEVSFILDKDGMPPVIEGKAKLEEGAARIEGTLGEPGFLRCRVTWKKADGKTQTAMAAAGFDPLKITPSLPVPDDFDAFWAEQKARLAKVPMTPELTPVPSAVEGIEAFDVQIPCVEPRPVSGYFARPKGAGPKSLPAILSVHGAGVRSSGLGSAVWAARQYNALGMDINAHGIPNGKPDEFYTALAAGELKDYRAAGRDDRQTCYFLGMFLRLVRAMEFLTSQPEWDGKILIVQGSSQGGGQSIAAAGLDPRVTLIAAGVPAICDHSGKAAGRINGWPKLVPDENGVPDAKILQVARYFDAMNFATRAKAEAVVSVGFIDGTCPPTSVYAAYNNLPGKKQMTCEPLMGHTTFPSHQKAAAAAIAEHIARLKAE